MIEIFLLATKILVKCIKINCSLIRSISLFSYLLSFFFNKLLLFQTIIIITDL